MASRSARRRATRRNRRKAKASSWHRMPKKGGVVGHGSGLGMSHAVVTKGKRRELEPDRVTRKTLTHQPLAKLEASRRLTLHPTG